MLRTQTNSPIPTTLPIRTIAQPIQFNAYEPYDYEIKVERPRLVRLTNNPTDNTQIKNVRINKS